MDDVCPSFYGHRSALAPTQPVRSGLIAITWLDRSLDDSPPAKFLTRYVINWLTHMYQTLLSQNWYIKACNCSMLNPL